MDGHPTNEQPKDIGELKLRIAAQSLKLSELQEHVARTAFSRPDLVAFGSTGSLAVACSVSPATIVRTVEALGFNSFREFKAIFQAHLKKISRRDSGVAIARHLAP